MSTPRRIEIYDTTLRDGTQGEGFNLSLQDKLLIAAKLDELGVDYIEGGFPLSNPKDEQFFRDVRELKLKNAKVAAFGMTRRRGVKAEEDPGMKALFAAETPVITIVGKSSEFHVTTVLGVSPEENLAMIGDTVKLLRQGGRQVVYDAEHFFDAYKANPAYAIRTLLAAQEAGASVLALCDTNGGSMPELIAEAVAAVKQKTSAMVGIHTHNDAGVAVANALTAIRNGAAHAQGTINGVGERCGNMDLITLIANLQLKYKFDCLRPGTLRHLTETSRYVYETANFANFNWPNYKAGSPTLAPSHAGLDNRRIIVMPLVYTGAISGSVHIGGFGAFLLLRSVTNPNPSKCNDIPNPCGNVQVEYIGDGFSIGRGSYDPTGACTTLTKAVLYK